MKTKDGLKLIERRFARSPRLKRMLAEERELERLVWKGSELTVSYYKVKATPKNIIENSCCESMKYHLGYRCRQHRDVFECPDNLIAYFPRSRTYGLIVHNGGTSFVEMHFCPWCGKDLTRKTGKQAKV